MTPLRLSRHALPSLPPPLQIPSYNRSQLTPGILHFGFGNFHRAHQAYYLHNLFSQHTSLNFGIIAAGILPSELPLHGIFHQQQGYYTLLTHPPTSTSQTTTPSSTPQLIASILDYLPPTNSATILSQLINPAIRLVTLTITEGGYYLDNHARFNSSHPAVIDDVARLQSQWRGQQQQSQLPRTVFGLLAHALHLRRESGVPPFTVLSCDNLQHNGTVARDAVVGTASLADEALAEWIRHEVRFPNCMVDRITPATDVSLHQHLETRHGVSDGLAVQCEQYVQWVIEDEFGQLGRPELERVGVQFVRDVSGWEEVKIRVLNGGHAVLGYTSALLDYEFGYEGMGDGMVRRLLDTVVREEILPAVKGVVDGVDVEEYYQSVCIRFANAGLRDGTKRLCMDGSNRQPKFIVPSVRDALKRGGKVDGLALVCALWCRYCYGVTEGGREIEANDERWGELKGLARRAREEGGAVWLEGLEGVYGKVGRDVGFQEKFERWVGNVWKKGVRGTIEVYLREG